MNKVGGLSSTTVRSISKRLKGQGLPPPQIFKTHPYKLAFAGVNTLSPGAAAAAYSTITFLGTIQKSKPVAIFGHVNFKQKGQGVSNLINK